MQDSGSRRRLTLLTGQQEGGDTHGSVEAGRFLDEVRETAGPVRLMRLFGITSYTAIHYVCAAHPERFAIDPTQA
ncbi:hypothetical protein ACWGH7_31475 [Streptomyces cyaneofuscatus]|uniref:hypothetical protein n=1 Tax=Streptomyces cyaneofuscatus TaxID=66883 RepID=UPI003796B80B